jgi:hypothetical protein
MTNPTPKRFRPRFSIRTLVVLVTLICVNFGLWGATKNQGIDDVRRLIHRPWTESEYESLRTIGEAGGVSWDEAATLPLVVGVSRSNGAWTSAPAYRRCYYFWFFGYAAKLRYERDLEFELEADSLSDDKWPSGAYY